MPPTRVVSIVLVLTTRICYPAAQHVVQHYIGIASTQGELAVHYTPHVDTSCGAIFAHTTGSAITREQLQAITHQVAVISERSARDKDLHIAALAAVAQTLDNPTYLAVGVVTLVAQRCDIIMKIFYDLTRIDGGCSWAKGYLLNKSVLLESKERASTRIVDLPSCGSFTIARSSESTKRFSLESIAQDRIDDRKHYMQPTDTISLVLDETSWYANQKNPSTDDDDECLLL